MVCRYCGHGDTLLGSKHYRECPFNPHSIPMREANVPPIIIDPFLATKDQKKTLEAEFNAGKWRKLSDGKLQRENLEIAWPT